MVVKLLVLIALSLLSIKNARTQLNKIHSWFPNSNEPESKVIICKDSLKVKDFQPISLVTNLSKIVAQCAGDVLQLQMLKVILLNEDKFET